MTATKEPDGSAAPPVIDQIDFRAEVPEQNLQYPFGLKIEEKPPEVVVEPPKPEKKKIILYAAGAAVAGVLLVMIFASGNFNLFGIENLFKTASPVNDMGATPYSAAGLIGHLVVQSDGKLEYKLRIEPASVQQQAGFAASIATPPEPVSVDWVLKDAAGFSLCGKHVVLPYNPQLTVDNAAPRPRSKTSGAPNENDAIDAAKAQEADRQKGQDLFQNEVGQDGQIAAITAQGELACSADAYKKADYWDFSTNFPLVAAQQEIVVHPPHLGKPTHILSAPARPAPGFYVEGDDVVRSVDASRGVIQLSTGKTFFIDSKKGKQADLSGWAGVGAQIHYKCDSNAACTLIRSGTGAVIHAHLSR